MANEMNRPKKGCVALKSFFALVISVRIGETNMRRWFLFKQLRVEQGVDKLPATHGAWIEHMRHDHVQANTWHHDMVLKLTCLDPLTMGWRYLVLVLSH